MDALWHAVNMVGGPLDGATVCIPCRSNRIDHWIWSHECLLWNTERDMWQWASACVSGFYQLSDNIGSCEIEPDTRYVFHWHDLHLTQRRHIDG